MDKSCSRRSFVQRLSTAAATALLLLQLILNLSLSSLLSFCSCGGRSSSFQAHLSLSLELLNVSQVHASPPLLSLSLSPLLPILDSNSRRSSSTHNRNPASVVHLHHVWVDVVERDRSIGAAVEPLQQKDNDEPLVLARHARRPGQTDPD